MPELPEVEVVCRGLDALICGEKIGAITTFRDGLRYPFPDFSELVGASIEQVCRRSKYILIRCVLEQGEPRLLVWHLGMTGQFHVLPMAAEAGKHEHVRLDFEDGQSLRYRDARRFGYAGVFSEASWLQSDWYQALGPEPLSPSFHADYFYALCKKSNTAIKPLMMQARAVVGVGNIYASESLFQAGIHPKRMAKRIAYRRVEALVLAIQQTLSRAIDAGGSSISDFVQVDGKPGYFAHDFYVYGREGAPCRRCSAQIKRMVQTGRSTFYCPQCQR